MDRRTTTGMSAASSLLWLSAVRASHMTKWLTLPHSSGPGLD